MTMQELVNKIAEKEEISKAEARRRLDNFEAIITEGLVTDGVVKFATLGSLKKVARAARVVKNPRNRAEEIQVPAKNTIKHIVSNDLESKVNA